MAFTSGAEAFPTVGTTFEEILITFLAAADHLDVVADIGYDIRELVAEHDYRHRLLVDGYLTDGDREVIGVAVI